MKLHRVRIRTWAIFLSKIVLVLGIGFSALVVLALSCENTFSRFECHQLWRDSGMRHRFDWWAGCMVEPRPGKWIPAKNYREVSP